MAEDKKMPEVIEEMKRVLIKTELTEGDITEVIAAISNMQEVMPIRDGEQYRAYEERYQKMMKDAGFVGQNRSWEEYMDYVRTPAGRLALALFNRVAEWKKEKGVP
jgi:hypothetical protein